MVSNTEANLSPRCNRPVNTNPVGYKKQEQTSLSSSHDVDPLASLEKKKKTKNGGNLIVVCIQSSRLPLGARPLRDRHVVEGAQMLDEVVSSREAAGALARARLDGAVCAERIMHAGLVTLDVGDPREALAA